MALGCWAHWHTVHTGTLILILTLARLVDRQTCAGASAEECSGGTQRNLCIEVARRSVVSSLLLVCKGCTYVRLTGRVEDHAGGAGCWPQATNQVARGYGGGVGQVDSGWHPGFRTEVGGGCGEQRDCLLLLSNRGARHGNMACKRAHTGRQQEWHAAPFKKQGRRHTPPQQLD